MVVFKRLILRRWRLSKGVLGLILLEYPLTVAILALFGIAAPNLYRTSLWEDGAENGFNSHPRQILYSHANHRPVDTPLVWSQFITNFNIIISVLSMFLLLVKTVMYTMHIFIPLLSIFIHGVLAALYTYSVYGQSAPDLIDPDRRVKGPPWYITNDCKVTKDKSLVGYCQQAKASFIVTALMMAVFCFHIILALWSLVLPRKERLASELSAHEIESSSNFDMKTEESLHAFHQPRTPGSAVAMKSPMTPRTTAFHTLGGTGETGLPFRDRYGS